MEWPPTVADLREDLGLAPADALAGDDGRLASVLSAAVAYVERARAGSFAFDVPVGVAPTLPRPDHDLCLGAVRLAGRYHTRRRSPDGLVSAGELGNSRVPLLDSDIERLLGIGRFARPVIA